MRRKQVICIVAMAAAVLAAGECSRSLALEFEILDVGSPVGISADGSVVMGEHRYTQGGCGPGGGCTHPVHFAQPFRWSLEDGVTDLGAPPTGSLVHNAVGISADGSTMIVSTEVFTGLDRVPAFYQWTADGGYTPIDDLTAPSPLSMHIWATSADCSAFVGMESGQGYQTFLWTADRGKISIDGMPGDIHPRDISDDGRVVVGYNHYMDPATFPSSEMRAFRWTEDEGAVPLGNLVGGEKSQAFLVSGDGETIVGAAESELGMELFRWTESEGMVGLGVQLRSPTDPDIHVGDEDGSRMVNISSTWTIFDMTPDASTILGSINQRSFLWDDVHGMRYADEALMEDYGITLPTGYLITRLSDDGTVFVGSTGPSDESMPVSTWRLAVPEPSTVVMLLTAMAGCGVGAWRRRRGRVG